MKDDLNIIKKLIWDESKCCPVCDESVKLDQVAVLLTRTHDYTSSYSWNDRIEQEFVWVHIGCLVDEQKSKKIEENFYE
jgi:hypothetical protein